MRQPRADSYTCTYVYLYPSPHASSNVSPYNPCRGHRDPRSAHSNASPFTNARTHRYERSRHSHAGSHCHSHSSANGYTHSNPNSTPYAYTSADLYP